MSSRLAVLALIPLLTAVAPAHQDVDLARKWGRRALEESEALAYSAVREGLVDFTARFDATVTDADGASVTAHGRLSHRAADDRFAFTVEEGGAALARLASAVAAPDGSRGGDAIVRDVIRSSLVWPDWNTRHAADVVALDDAGSVEVRPAPESAAHATVRHWIYEFGLDGRVERRVRVPQIANGRAAIAPSVRRYGWTEPDADGRARLASIAIEGPGSSTTGTLEHTLVDGLWLPTRLDHDVRLDFASLGAPIELRVVVELSEFTLDPGLGDDVFERATTESGGGPLAVGGEAPDWELARPDGTTVRLSALRGSVVVLDFWATWCGPCRRVMPGLQALHARFADEPVVVIGMNTQETGDAPGYMRSQGFTYELLMDADRVARDYGVTGLPTLVVVDPEGLVAHVSRGAAPGLERRLEREVRALLDAVAEAEDDAPAAAGHDGAR